MDGPPRRQRVGLSDNVPWHDRYDTLGPESVAYICGHAELSAIACSAQALGSLLEALPEKPHIKLVVRLPLPLPLPLPPTPSRSPS